MLEIYYDKETIVLFWSKYNLARKYEIPSLRITLKDSSGINIVLN